MPSGSHTSISPETECLGVDIRNFFDDFLAQNVITTEAFDALWKSKRWSSIWDKTRSEEWNKEVRAFEDSRYAQITFFMLHRALGFLLTDVIDKTHDFNEHPCACPSPPW